MPNMRISTQDRTPLDGAMHEILGPHLAISNAPHPTPGDVYVLFRLIVVDREGAADLDAGVRGAQLVQNAMAHSVPVLMSAMSHTSVN